MNNERIKKMALGSGFKLKEQPNGDMDLNPYVYDFARALLDSRWISVKDGLPNTSDCYLVYMRDKSKKTKGYHDITFYHQMQKIWDSDGKGDLYDVYYVTHWQKLPEPPKGDE